MSMLAAVCRSPRRLFPMAGVLGCSLLLSACNVALFPEKTPQRQFTLPYQFEAGDLTAESGQTLPVLKIETPQASGLTAGKRIVLETRPNELAAYSNVRWSANMPELLRNHLVRALREDPRLNTVVSDASGAASQVTLSSAILSFHEQRAGERPQVELYLQTQLIRNGSRETLTSRDFRITVPLQDSSIEGSVAAFGRAADRLAAEAADWIVSALADD